LAAGGAPDAKDLKRLPASGVGSHARNAADRARCRVSRTNWQTGAMAGRSFSGEDIAIIRPEEIRQLQERHALVIAENGKPITTRLSRCIDGRSGARLLGGPAKSPR
jgi:hypothetical protein